MSQQPRAFLPAEALTSERVSRAFGNVLEGWRRAWFRSASVDISIGSASRPFAPGDDGDAAVRRAARLSLSRPGRRRLIEAALDESLEGKVLTPADRQLLDTFADRLASDLADRLEPLLGPEDGQPMALDLVLDARSIGTLAVSREAIVGLVRASLPRKPRNVGSLISRTGALNRLVIEVEAVLGRSVLTLEDAKELSAGDVIILDRRLDANTDIRLGEGGAPIAQGRLVHDQGRNSIIIDKSGKGFN